MNLVAELFIVAVVVHVDETRARMIDDEVKQHHRGLQGGAMQPANGTAGVGILGVFEMDYNRNFIVSIILLVVLGIGYGVFGQTKPVAPVTK